MKIYTKTGDTGHTSLIAGTRIPKTNLRVVTYGTADELNSHIGLLVAELESLGTFHSLCKQLFEVQNLLFNAGSILACEDPKLLSRLDPVSEAHVVRLEKQMDEWTHELPKLSQFILPGGSKVGAQLHICRTVCRRAERNIVSLIESMDPPGVPEELKIVLIFMNRLSDYFFVGARWVNLKLNRPDVLWQKDI
jgi:cob(I)alamin adenosyltransferase